MPVQADYMSGRILPGVHDIPESKIKFIITGHVTHIVRFCKWFNSDILAFSACK
jgi:hypothetical protein